jgi:DNA-binding MarR family transcriptional regulator
MSISANPCLCIEVRSAAQKLTRLYDDALADAGITVTQLSQLNSIRDLGSPTLTDLATATGLDRSTLGRNLRLLEKEGLVSLCPGKDARTREINLTRAGINRLKKGGPLWHNIQADLTTRLGPEKRQLLNELLSELTHIESNNNEPSTGESNRYE